jgi:ABC-type sulfate transport system permease component
MKSFAIKLVWFVTIYLLIFTVLSQFNTPHALMYSLFIIGHGLVIFMVYKVLRDAFTTQKTFEDWYQDHSIRR